MHADGVVTANEVLDLIDECTRFIVTGLSLYLIFILYIRWNLLSKSYLIGTTLNYYKRILA